MKLTPTQQAIVRAVRASTLYRAEIAKRLSAMPDYLGPHANGYYLQKELDAMCDANILYHVPNNSGQRAYSLCAMHDTDFLSVIGNMPRGDYEGVKNVINAKTEEVETQA